MRIWDPVLLVILISLACLWAAARHDRRAWLAGWLFYLVTLAPVIGIIPTGPQGGADRYAYLATLPAYFAAGAGVYMILRQRNRWRTSLALATCLVLTVFLAWQTRQQLPAWKNEFTAWSNAYAFYPDDAYINHELGAALLARGDPESAAVHFQRAYRADPTMIRSNEERSSVEGTFKIMPKVRDQVHDLLKEHELLYDEDYVTLSREFRREGRNIARVNGRTVNLALLRSLGDLLIDLHGQSEHLSLLKVQNHLGLLDRFAGSEKERAEYKETYKKLSAVRKELAQLRAAEEDAARRMELLEFQEARDYRLMPAWRNSRLPGSRQQARPGRHLVLQLRWRSHTSPQETHRRYSDSRRSYCGSASHLQGTWAGQRCTPRR